MITLGEIVSVGETLEEVSICAYFSSSAVY